MPRAKGEPTFYHSSDQSRNNAAAIETKYRRGDVALCVYVCHIHKIDKHGIRVNVQIGGHKTIGDLGEERPNKCTVLVIDRLACGARSSMSLVSTLMTNERECVVCSFSSGSYCGT
jgi:hypothetical protein